MTTREMVHIALFAAIVAALGLLPPIALPVVPVPVTAQTLGVMLAGAVAGARRGGLALLLFLALVALGLPLLAGGRGGLAVFFGPGGGFVVAFPLAAFVIGVLVERSWPHAGVWQVFGFNVVGGIGVVYLVGVPWLAAVAHLSLWQAASGAAVFIPGDLVKAVIAASVAVTVNRAFPIIVPRSRSAASA